MPVGAGLAIAGVGTVVGGIVQSHASNNATRAQMHANDDALAYQREQDTYNRGIEERKYQDYQNRRAEWLARRPGGPDPAASAPVNTSPTANAARQAVGGTGADGTGPVAGGTPLAELVGGQESAPPADVSAAPAGVAAEGGTSLADLVASGRRWSDHNQYFQA